MSFMFIYDGKFTSFNNFLLLKEAIEPKETKFGSDFKNEKWEISQDKTLALTFFTNEKDSICVSLNLSTGELGFGTCKGKETIDLAEYDMSRTNLGDALKTFNKVFYIALAGVKTLNLDQILFSGQDKRLDKTYQKIANNKFFQDKLKDNGFAYIGQDVEENFIFKRI